MLEIIIIGAGPAGISMAVEAINAGINKDKILVIEKMPEHSYSLRRYYPENKKVTATYKGAETKCTGVMCIPDLSKHETISYLDKTIKDYKINVQYNEIINKIHMDKKNKFFTIYSDKGSYETRILVIAIGILGKLNKPDYPIPSTLHNRILYEINTVKINNSNILVVGGGDSASEFAQYFLENGNEVTLSYRQDSFYRMNNINRDILINLFNENKIKIFYQSNIIQIIDYNGKPRVYFKEDQYGIKDFDYMIYALGGTTPHNFLKIIGIEFDGEEPDLLEGYETNIPGLFLIGDISTGKKGGSIIHAFNSANSAMQKICNDYLKCKEECKKNI